MPSYAYFHKQFVPLSEAKIGVMTHCLHYGTAIFEGIRGNWNSQHKQIYLFRLKEHYQRLFSGCKLLKIDLPYTIDELSDNGGTGREVWFSGKRICPTPSL